jgi:transposase/transposase-like protein
MGKPYSIDLRERVVGAVEREGLSRRRAAARFGVSYSAAIDWVKRHRQTGSLKPGQIGGHKPKKISGDWREWLLAEARASGAEAMLAHLKLMIAKLKRERFGRSSEHRRRLLDQLELQLEELEATAAEDACAAKAAAVTQPRRDESVAPGAGRRRPVRAPLLAHLPQERVVIPAPPVCPCCQGKLVKLGEDVTETLEVIPRQWKVIQTVREKFSCRACERITQSPAPFHPIARGRAGAGLLAMVSTASTAITSPSLRFSPSALFAASPYALDSATLPGRLSFNERLRMRERGMKNCRGSNGVRIVCIATEEGNNSHC